MLFGTTFGLLKTALPGKKSGKCRMVVVKTGCFHIGQHSNIVKRNVQEKIVLN